MSESSAKIENLEKKYCPTCYGQFEGQINECPNDKTILRGASNDPLIGKIFADRYQIQSVLGLGGMSVVYKAQHRLMDRIVAIKMLHSKLKEDVTSLERFKLEAQAASSLSHQNIISVYDFGVTDDGEPFFVMDCLEGEDLSSLIERKGKVPYQRALPIFRQIADGLDAAHKKQIVHRDLKPANVVLIKQDDGTEMVKLVDFGIAKLLPGSGKQAQHLTQTGEVFGSPIYMSPEQCLGRELDTRSDIYALGCLMYETLSGDAPFLGDSFLETMNKHVGEEPKAFSEVAPDAKIPSQVEELVRRCMAKDPSNRFQTAGEVSDLITTITIELLGHSGRHGGFITGAVPVAKVKSHKVSKSLILSAALASLIGCAVAFCAFWPGPPEDRGTLLNKMLWQLSLSQASNSLKNGDYPAAEKEALTAESMARALGDQQTRLEATLRMQAELYDKWEGHAANLEKVNSTIADIQIQRIKAEFLDKMKLLSALEEPENSGVRQSNQALKAEAQIPGIISTASKLYGRGLLADGKTLLSKALAVETKLLGRDNPSLAQIQSKLADFLIQLREFSSVRTLLTDALQLRKKHRSERAADYLRASNKLGQFDLDQSNFKEAEKELSAALEEAKQLHDKDILLLCMRSYADLLRQTNRLEQSKSLLAEADALERGLN
jgi:serine/threonine protein kinase